MEVRIMTGSSLAPFIIPLAVTPALFIWLFMIYYADRHPDWRRRTRPGHGIPMGTGPAGPHRSGLSPDITARDPAGRGDVPGTASPAGAGTPSRPGITDAVPEHTVADE